MKTKYAVLKPNITFYAFGKCVLVSRTTSSFVFYTKKTGGFSYDEKVSKKNVMFFCDEDITKEIDELNKLCWSEHKLFEKNLLSLRKKIKEKHES